MVEVTISDIHGRLLGQLQSGDSENSGHLKFDMRTYPAGIYLVTVNNGNKTFVEKVVKL